MNILIVEDNYEIANMYKKHCEFVTKDTEKELTCYVIHSCKEFDENKKYDLAICDYSLKENNSIPIIEKLYKTNCYIAIITCCAFLKEINDYIKDKKIDLISKPISLSILDSLIEYAYFKKKYLIHNQGD